MEAVPVRDFVDGVLESFVSIWWWNQNTKCGIHFRFKSIDNYIKDPFFTETTIAIPFIFIYTSIEYITNIWYDDSYALPYPIYKTGWDQRSASTDQYIINSPTEAEKTHISKNSLTQIELDNYWRIKRPLHR